MKKKPKKKAKPRPQKSGRTGGVGSHGTGARGAQRKGASMSKRKHLPVLKVGKKYEGYIGFSDGEPVVYPRVDYYGADPVVCVFVSRAAARRTYYGSVRRVTIIVEEQKS